MADATRFETTKPAPDRVLIVEDEENARIGYEALLRRWGHEVLGVASAEDALARFAGPGDGPCPGSASGGGADTPVARDGKARRSDWRVEDHEGRDACSGAG